MYTLRFPFTLPQGWEIGVSEESGELDGLTFSLKKQNRFYVFTINGFATEDAAKSYITNVWAGLMWLLLHRGLSPHAVWEPQKITYADDPYQAAENVSRSFGLEIVGPVDCLIDGSLPAVYPTDKHVRAITAEPFDVRVSTAVEHALMCFREGAGFRESTKAIDDVKLRVGLELYGAYFNEISSNAKFLALVMALEALATGTPRTSLVLDLQEKWMREVAELQKSATPGTADAVSLEALNNDLQSRRANSIGHQIRSLVCSTLQANGDEDADVMGREAGRVYDHRSTLVHEGKLEPQVLSKATLDAKNIVERVLRARLVQKANPGAK